MEGFIWKFQLNSLFVKMVEWFLLSAVSKLESEGATGELKPGNLSAVFLQLEVT